MKLIIAGSRSGFTQEQVSGVLDENVDVLKVDEVVSGSAIGVDKYGELWAYSNNIDVKRFPADWKSFGKRAGFKRNAEMGKYADCLIAFWDEKSKGTRHMINVMNDLRKEVIVVTPYNLDETEEDEQDE